RGRDFPELRVRQYVVGRLELFTVRRLCLSARMSASRQVMSVRGKPGIKGAPGERGERGQKGDKGDPGPVIVGWQIDQPNYRAIPVMSGGPKARRFRCAVCSNNSTRRREAERKRSVNAYDVPLNP